MKESVKKTLQQLSLYTLLFIFTTSAANAQYTLTDADVVVTGGIIQSCSYDFAITDIIIPSTLDGQTVTGIVDAASIYSGVFYNKGITSVVFPSTITMIGLGAFNTNVIASVDLSACTALTTIGGSAFYYNSLTELDLSSCTSLSSIGESAFIWNEISNLNFNNCSSLSSIGTYAFAHGRLINLDLSPCSSLTLIDANAFYNNHNDDYSTYLTTFYLPSTDIDGYKLDYWADGNSVHYAGGDAVSDLETSYTANLSEAYDVTFTITDGTNPVANATVSLTGYGTATTNALGVAIITDVVPASNISYTVTEKSYSPASGTVSVVATNVSEAVSLSVLTTYTLTDDDVVVTGGVIQSCSYDFTIKNIIIPETLDGQTVTGIKDGGYSTGIFYNKGLKSVVLPAGLTFIGDYTFNSNSIASVDFSACTNLVSIGYYSFNYNQITNIDLSACVALTDIESSAFYSNSIATINISNCTNLKTIGSYAFYNNLLTSIDFSSCSSLTSIGSYAFYHNSLSSLNLSACTGLTTIGDFTFSYNALTDINLPGSITSIGAAAFNTNKIATINGTASDGIIFSRNADASIDNTNIISYGGVATTVSLPAQIKTIGTNAFRSNSLTNVDFSACTALTSVGGNAFSYNSLTAIDLSACTALTLIESYAFYSNSGLTSFTLPTPNYTGFSGWKDSKNNSYAAGASVSDFTANYHAVIPYTLTDDDVVVTDGIIQSCSYDFNFTDIIIPEILDGQAVIGIKDGGYSTGVFYNKGITSMAFPASLTFIGDYTFRSNSITSVDFSACTNLSSIGYYSFGYNQITNIDLSACTALTDIESYAFTSNSISSINISTCSNLKTIGNYAFYYNVITSIDFSSCSALSSIGSYAFYHNSLSSIDLSACTVLKTIGDFTFSYNALTDINLPGSITSIGAAAFNTNKIAIINGAAADGIIYARNADASIDNTNIISYGGASSTVSLPAQIKIIGTNAFRSNSLTNVDFSACTALTSIGANAFSYNSLTAIDLSACTALTLIESYAFYSNSGLTSFTLPTPDYTGFSGWQDGKNNNYAAGASVSDYTTFYHAVIPYTLTDDDVVVTDGIIQSCSYDFSFTDIIIPDILDGQTVVGIRNGSYSSDGVFYNKGITSVVFPSGILTIGDYAFRSNSITSIDLSASIGLTTIGYYTFANNLIKSLDLSMCSALSKISDGAFNTNSIGDLNLNSCSALTSIGSYAFYYNSLTSLDLSSCTSLSTIDYNAFYHNSLTSIDLSTCSALTTIGEYAFSYNSLDEVSLPGSITSMGRAAFNSNKITKINGVNSDGIFYAYNADASVDSTTIVSYGGISNIIAIPEKVITIGTYAFRSSALTSIDFSACVNLKTIEDYAFSSNNLTSIDLSACSALIYIDSYAFGYNYSMASFALPSPDYTGFQGWKDGNENTFAAGALVSDYTTFYRAVIPYTLTDEDVVVTNGVIQSCSYDFAFADIIIPGTLDGQTVIGIRDGANSSDGVFYNKGIKSIVFPASIDSIGNYAFRSNYISSADFSACTGLRLIGVEAFAYNSLKNIDFSTCISLQSIKDNAFRSNSISSINLSNCSALQSIGGSSFMYNSLTSIDFSYCSALTTIEASAFYSNSISSLDFSACVSLTTIEGSAFSSNSLSNIDLNACTALTYIGTYAFYNNSGLSSFTLPTPDYTGFISWMDGNGNSYAAGASVTDFITMYHALIPYTLTDDDVVVTNGIIESCSYDFTFTDIIIPGTLDGQTVTGIKDGDWSGGVFYNKGITSVVLPASLNYIGAYAFRFNALTGIDLSVCSNLTFIGGYAFQSNNLKNLDLSANTLLTEIGYDAFASNSLINVNMSSCTALITIGGYAFYYNAITNLDLSGCTSLTSIGYNAFYYNYISNLDLSTCTALTNISEEAFSHNSLTEITIPGSITSIGAAAFNTNQIVTINGVASDGIIYARNEDATEDNTTIVSYGGVSTIVTIPSLVETIGTNAFRSNSLTSVDFSASAILKTLGNYAFYNNSLSGIDFSACTSLKYIGYYAFSSNSGLSSFNLPIINYTGFESWLDGNGNDFAGGDAVTSLNTYYRAKIVYTLTDDDVVVTDGIIQSCSYDFTFTDIIIPETLDGQSVIGIKDGSWNDGVFYNKGMSSLVLPSSLTFIGDYAFYSNSLVLVDFSACSALISIGNSSFDYNQLSSLDLSSCSLLSSIGDNAFDSNNLTSVDLTSCTVLTSIGSYAFYYSDLTSIDLSYCTSLKTIGSRAFYNNNLTGIDLSNCTALTYIGTYAFYSNYFTEFTLPTPNIAFADFNYWLDGGDNQFAGGAVVSNFYTSYTANLTGTLSVNFTVTDGSNPISGATIEFGDYPSAFSDASGVASFTTVIPENDIAYTVYASNYVSISGTISVVDTDVNEEIQLVLTGFNELTSAKLNIYPNPVMDVLTITQPSNENITGVEIYNLQGQKIKTETIINNQSKIKLNVQDLNKGNYILKCITRNNIYSITIIKE